jgi:hypothetical protein
MTGKATYSTEQVNFSKLCRSLGHPARVALLGAIAKESTCVENRILPMEQVGFLTVVKHLKALHNADLVKGNITSLKDLSYCVNWERLDDFKMMFDELYDEIQEHRDKVMLNKGKCTK